MRSIRTRLDQNVWTLLLLFMNEENIQLVLDEVKVKMVRYLKNKMLNLQRQ